jgi:hypothetical protein
MDAVRFDHLAVAVAGRTTRRTALALLSGLGLSALLIQDAQAVCKDNGSRCQQSNDCCSGRCIRKPGTSRKFCRAAPDQGICTIALDRCGSTTTVCGSARDNSTCYCFLRPNGASVCARFDPTNKCNFSGECTAAKCRAAFAAYPNGTKAFCGQCDICGSAGQSGICLLPCDNPDPA